MRMIQIAFCCIVAQISLLVLAVLAAPGPSGRQPDGQMSFTKTEQSSPATPEQSRQSVRTGEQIKWQVISAGGIRGTSTNFILFGTAGQTAVGKGSSTNFQVNQGFWQNFEPSFICGDANKSGIVNIADVVYLIQYIFAGGPAPNPLLSGDVNCNVIVNIADVVYLIQYIFSGGPAPCAVCR